ncbi:MAG TPA: hypothetical protein VFG83_16770, partial [Kofleriaceae bacterium]|nr:hypothetical protein [Kofleriaceae bacterium]
APDTEPDHERDEPASAERPALEFTLNSPELEAIAKDLAAIARAVSGPRSERIRRAVDTSRSVEADE